MGAETAPSRGGGNCRHHVARLSHGSPHAEGGNSMSMAARSSVARRPCSRRAKKKTDNTGPGPPPTGTRN
eukprot:125166-Lingulodinium_polyedra.AAC.1